MRTRRWWFYLLLNALVSACVTGGILFVYDRYHRSACPQPLPAPATGAASDHLTEDQVDILTVSGAGVVATEVVVIKNNGLQAVDLSGWTLRDADGAVYTFPTLTVYPQGMLKVHTASGVNTPLDLYWNRSSAVWEAGEIVSLFDAQGTLRALYTIP
jgi:hypothetical protein